MGGTGQGQRSSRQRLRQPASRLLRGSQTQPGLDSPTGPKMGAWALLLPLLVAVAQAQGALGRGGAGRGGRRAGAGRR